MKYLDEYRDKNIALKLVDEIKNKSTQPIRIMEVCGGHTMAIRKYGIHNLLPESVALLSGPGCPVCVTGRSFIDKAVEYARMPDSIITTYGDLIRVPGSESSLDKEKAKGADVRIIYSTLEAIALAEKHPDKKVFFLGIGFETTTPSTAIALQKAKEKQLKNFFVLSAHKVMPPAMSALIEGGSKIDGYIGPGHVSTIAGSKIYKPLTENYDLSVVISGFEPTDMLHSILMLVEQIESGKREVGIQYSRAVSFEGNIKAQKLVEKTFQYRADTWRGIGSIPASGLTMAEEYAEFDAERVLPLKIEETPEPKACLCGSILKGMNTPNDCKLFGTACTPENPVGACMVSAEGTCAAYYKYSG